MTDPPEAATAEVAASGARLRRDQETVALKKIHHGTGETPLSTSDLSSRVTDRIVVREPTGLVVEVLPYQESD